VATQRGRRRRRAKSEGFTEGLGARVGRLIRLAEPSTHPIVSRASRQPLVAGAVAEPSMPIERGEHEVIAAIEVTFALELD
jgi:uncharacterized protein YggE